MLIRLRIFWLAVVTIIVAPRVWAGESGLNVIVVVNQNSSNSLQLGNDYCERRAVPPQNLFRMTGWTGGATNWQQSDFENDLLDPLLAMISTNGLTNQAQIILLSMDIPYRVINGDSENGTTSALFYGFKTNTPPPPGLPDTCSLPEDSTNSYAYSELPFALAEPQTASTNAFLAVMLTDTSLPQAESTLRRGVASDSSFPPQTVYLEKTTDSDRNVRFILFDNAVQECRARGDDAVMRTNSDFTAFTNALGLDTGLGAFSLATNGFVPGAVGDDLTSYGGYILEYSGQTPLLAFLEAGASGSYGTVVEPCNYTYKFPDPMVYFYQDRGFCLAEAYYQSLSNPYEGLMVGEPLSAPFARPGTTTWNSPAAGSVISNLAAFNVAFSAAEPNAAFNASGFVCRWLIRPDHNQSTAERGQPSFGDHRRHRRPTTRWQNGDSLDSAAQGLASAVNNEETFTGVEAEAVGDRLVLRSQDVAKLGSQISLQAGAIDGPGARL